MVAYSSLLAGGDSI
jgi:hypothetical protein